jgi:hypothetical protein
MSRTAASSAHSDGSSSLFSLRRALLSRNPWLSCVYLCPYPCRPEVSRRHQRGRPYLREFSGVTWNRNHRKKPVDARTRTQSYSCHDNCSNGWPIYIMAIQLYNIRLHKQDIYSRTRCCPGCSMNSTRSRQSASSLALQSIGSILFQKLPGLSCACAVALPHNSCTRCTADQS